MILNLKESLGISRPHYKIQLIIDKTNMETSKTVMAIVMLFEICTFIISFFYKVDDAIKNPDLWWIQHRLAYITLFVIAFLVFLYVMTHKAEPGKYSHFVYNFLLILFLLFSQVFAIFISTQDYILNEQIFCFITIEIFLASFFIIRPLISFSMITVSFFFQYFFMEKFADVSLATQINYPILYISLLLVSTISYMRYCRIARYSIQNHILAEEMRRMSYYDPLTKLKNRLSLQDYIESIKSEKLLVMITDVDDFKTYNDKYGHREGDKVLIKYAESLKFTFGEDSCYRYGGDEFLIVTPYEEKEAFDKKIESLRDKIEGYFNFSGGYVRGLVTSAIEFRALVSLADKNLYVSKKNGKNLVTGE